MRTMLRGVIAAITCSAAPQCWPWPRGRRRTRWSRPIASTTSSRSTRPRCSSSRRPNTSTKSMTAWVYYNAKDPVELPARHCRELERRRRRHHLHLQDPRRGQVPLRQPADGGGRGLFAAPRHQAEPVAGLHRRPVRALTAGRCRAADGDGAGRPDAGVQDRQGLRPDRFSPEHAASSRVSSVVDAGTVEANAKGGDFGHEWLNTHSAGSGPYKLGAWKPNEGTGDGRGSTASLARQAGLPRAIFFRHVARPRPRRCSLPQQGRYRTSPAASTGEQIESLKSNPDVTLQEVPRGASVPGTISFNTQHRAVRRRSEVRRAAEVSDRLPRHGRTAS